MGVTSLIIDAKSATRYSSIDLSINVISGPTRKSKIKQTIIVAIFKLYFANNINNNANKGILYKSENFISTPKYIIVKPENISASK
jgi:hypothetical protein